MAASPDGRDWTAGTEDLDIDDAEPLLEDDLASILPPPGLKEISSLASWTVSSSKPGCGVSALRSSDMTQFWQSDGPQPHYLTIHFFKLVSIVHMRLFLNFDHDESYTPTKIQFWAGMGTHDLQEFAEMSFEHPKGWISVDFDKVGPIPDADGAQLDGSIDWSSRPVLRAFLVQVRVIENHQNGKDTHLRGLQIFAADPLAEKRPELSSPHKVVLTRRPKKSKTSALLQDFLAMEPELR